MMIGNRVFPESLLDSSVNARVDYFKEFVVGHKLLTEKFDELIENIYDPGEASVILVYGPTGVGKTTLRKKIVNRLIEDALPSLYEDKGKIPVFFQEAIAPDNGSFDWIDFYSRTLGSINEPLIEYKIEVEVESEIKPQDKTRRALRRALENALFHRRPSAFIIDEAQHLSKMTSGRKLKNQLDTLKSLASISQIPHVLIGTYELLDFRNLSGQLCRRGANHHFSRYQIENEEHRKIFIKILRSFQAHMPLPEEPDLVGYWDFFYERSIGCVGLLKNWLNRTFSAKLRAGATKLAIDDFNSFAYSLTECIQMIDEATKGEQLVSEDEDLKVKLREKTGLTKVEKEQNKPKKSNKKVGDRNPTRDTVGEAQ